MRSWFAQTVDAPPSGTAQKTSSFLSMLSKIYEESGVRYRVPLAVAISSVAFQEYPSWLRSAVKVSMYGRPALSLLAAAILLCSLLAASARTSRLAVLIFIVLALIAVLPDWMALANHTYLALWSIPAAILFREWWKSDLYALYLRITLGIVMLGAFSQKLLAGTYIDGSYIAWISTNGAPTERMFAFLCDSGAVEPCVFHQGISLFILAWQLAVGILLLLGLNSLIFLAIEIGFLLGAGVYADEMNFQVLNIALLCIIFRFGMPLWLLGISVALLVLDVYEIGELVKVVLNAA